MKLLPVFKVTHSHVIQTVTLTAHQVPQIMMKRQISAQGKYCLLIPLWLFVQFTVRCPKQTVEIVNKINDTKPYFIAQTQQQPLDRTAQILMMVVIWMRRQNLMAMQIWT